MAPVTIGSTPVAAFWPFVACVVTPPRRIAAIPMSASAIGTNAVSLLRLTPEAVTASGRRMSVSDMLRKSPNAVRAAPPAGFGNSALILVNDHK